MYMQYGEIMRTRRKELGISQRELAKRIPMSFQQISKIKKGNVPRNWRPVGSTRINIDGYCEIKTEEPRRWELRARYVWRKEHGAIHKGYVLLHVNGVKDDDRLENLQLISRNELRSLNQTGLFNLSEETNPSVIALAKLKCKISNRKADV